MILKKIKNKIGVGFYRTQDMLLYFKFRANKKNYAEYYAERMDRRIKRNPNWGLNLNKSFQLSYLKKKGLKPESKFLDYGAGALAAGIYFVDYLNVENYVGVDVSEKVLLEGKNRLNKKGLENKKAELIHIPAGNMDALEGTKFDFIWAQSVLTHMPPQEISSLFKSIRGVLKENSCFFANFKRSEKKGASHRDFQDWEFDEEFIVKLANSNDLKCEVVDDWFHPEDPAKKDTMLLITKM